MGAEPVIPYLLPYQFTITLVAGTRDENLRRPPPPPHL